MSNLFTITQTDIVEQIKLSLFFPLVLREALVRKTIQHTSAEMNITAEPEALQGAADTLRRSIGLLKESDTYSWFQNQQLSVDDFEEMVRIKLLADRLAIHLYADQVESFFEEHQQEYTQAIAYEVLLDDRELAMDLFYALQENEVSFAEVAREHHPDLELKRKGGYVGKLSRSDRPSELTDAIFAANPPDFLKPIVTAKGVYLIFVEEIIHPELTDSLRQRILTQLFDNWLNLQLENTQTEIQIA